MSDQCRSIRRFSLHARCLILGALSVLVAGCGGGDSRPTTGMLKLAITDGPACGYDHVYVTVEKIRVHQSATATGAVGERGWSELTLPAQRIDLLSLTNGVLQDLGSLPLAAGTYQQIRMVLASNPSNPTPTNPLANSVVVSGSTQEVALSTPSAQQSGFKLNANFELLAGQVADMVLDFDACKSIVGAGNSGIYNLKPVVSVIKRLTTEIQGYVSPAIAANVIVSTRDPGNNLRSTVPDAQTGKFRLAYLPEGATYTVVMTGQNLTTAAITGVPVSLASNVTQLNTAANAINLPASATATINGVVRNGSNVLLTDATVAARQTLSSGQVLDVATRAVNAGTAAYAMILPVAAPVRATYAAGGTLNFLPDSPSTPGLYNIYGSALGYTGQSTPPQVSLTAGATISKDLVLTP